VRFDNNKYSVLATAVGRPVEVHAYADRVVIRQDGVIVAEHARAFGRNQTVYDPWHYVPVLARKPGVLRNGAPFKDWVLPPAMAAIRRKLKGSDDGDRQMVQILSCVRDDGLMTVEAACREAIDQGVHSAPVVINILARRRDPAPLPLLLTPTALRLTHEPMADCARLTTASGGPADMERTPSPAVLGPMANHWLDLDLMSSLKLYGMRSAPARVLRAYARGDEVMAAGIKRQHEPPRIVGDLLQSEIAEVRRELPPVRSHAERHDPSATR
jgi:hypothetical protein